jgi:hypothetical protein
MANGNSILATLERKTAISTAQPERYTALRAVAETLSKRNVDQSTCELFNEALARLVQLAYEVDTGGLCNIDGVTGRFLIPLPFGRNGHARWGLKPSEANVLRQILFDWMLETPSLIHYDKSRRSWFVCLSAFPTIHVARTWLRAHQITVTVYRSARAKRVAR